MGIGHTGRQLPEEVMAYGARRSGGVELGSGLVSVGNSAVVDSAGGDYRRLIGRIFAPF